TVIDRYCQPIMAPRAAEFADRLRELACLFDRMAGSNSSELHAADKNLRDLAATAALALTSHRPLASQGFVRALLRMSFAESEYGWLLD
ncbi:MAG: hypothetical protein KGR26_11130, partial [Cyanobacteria bacterium REEB65]|nr:hypothetical protein [Cyanobacteria bacterium REEB65]